MRPAFMRSPSIGRGGSALLGGTRVPRLAAVVALGLVLALAGCGDDDGAGVRNVDGDSGSGSASGSGSGSGSGPASGSGSGSASGSGSGSGSGSATGLGAEDLSGSTDDEEVLAAVEEYKTWVIGEVEALVGDTKEFTDAVRSGDVAAAQAAYAPSRVRWERIEPIAGLVEEIDGRVDARVDDFAGEDDPEFTGWHRLEHQLWELESTSDSAAFADQLDADIATLYEEIQALEFPPAAVALGPAELIEEVSEGKITGEEDRYSHTDLWDFDANVDGSRKLIELLTPALEARDADLLAEIEQGFDDITTGLDAYATPDGGFRPYPDLTEEDKTRLQAQLAGLSERLALLPGVLEVQ